MPKTSFITRYRIIPLILVLALGNWGVWELVQRHRYDSIVLHHSASWHGNYETIRVFHQAKFPGVRDAAYHLILSNGSTGAPLGHLEPTGRYRNLSYSLATRNRRANLRAIHICVIGNYDQRPVPETMQPVIGHALQTLARKHRIPRENILFHRDVSPSACPGRHITKDRVFAWMDQAAASPAAIKDQHRSVINQAGFSPWTFPRPVLIGMVVLSLIFIKAWMLVFGLLHQRVSRNPRDTG